MGRSCTELQASRAAALAALDLGFHGGTAVCYRSGATKPVMERTPRRRGGATPEEVAPNPGHDRRCSAKGRGSPISRVLRSLGGGQSNV
jgi:hypothetical protein